MGVSLHARLEHHDYMTVEQMNKALWGARRPDSEPKATGFEPARMRMCVSISRVPATAGPCVALDLARLSAEPPS